MWRAWGYWVTSPHNPTYSCWLRTRLVRAMSSLRPMTREDFTPAAGSNSNRVTTGPGRADRTSPCTPKSGEHEDQIAPRLAQANIAGLAVRMPSAHWRLVDIVPGCPASLDRIVRKALETYLAEYADYRVALDRLRDKEDAVISAAELRKRIGL